MSARATSRPAHNTLAPPAEIPTAVAATTVDAPDERSRLMALFIDLVEPLGRALPTYSEVVLHDLGSLPRSIVAVHGDVTGRRVGDPATDLLLEQVASGDLRHLIGYRTQLADGRDLRSTTMVLRDSDGEPFAALCINSDLSVWESLQRVAGQMIGAARGGAGGAGTEASDAEPQESGAAGEVFVRDVDELAAHLIHEAIREQAVPVNLMKKEHKLAVVRSLKERGMFLLRDAVEMIATSLEVTRFTIYNYLNEIDDQNGSTPSRRTEVRLGKRKEIS
ncbi:helix-turn-helix transcriptional regulator [Georgenia faecalis]|uniref:helix-turn-helix transcriptional regulator n=1 Tax=Georgenia faecalis TaxID=2483799 RepID=UPI0019D0BE88|nr:transcriptional regulator [Georgenia faecalis]